MGNPDRRGREMVGGREGEQRRESGQGEERRKKRGKGEKISKAEFYIQPPQRLAPVKQTS